MSISIRFPEILGRDIHKAKRIHDMDIAEISRRALRKFNRVIGNVADLPDINIATKGISTTIEIDLPIDMSMLDFMKALSWYLSLYKDCKRPTPIDIDQKEIDGLYGFAVADPKIGELIFDKRIRTKE